MQAAKPIKWAILGAGKIAAKFAGALHEVESAIPFAVGSRDLNKAAKFAAELRFERPFGSYQAVLDCAEVDAVYIATPHPFHAEWTMRAARAGKHILCEKPMAMNVGEARSMFAAARQHGVFLMEAFMYRCHPQTGELVRLVAGDRIGDIRIIESSFNFHANFNPEGRLFAMRLGGGAILDVGCYAVSMPRLLFGASRGEAFANAAQVGGYAHFGQSGCDEYAVGSLQFSEGRLAQVSAGIRLERDNALRVYGTDGYLVVPFPWWCREGVRVYDSGATSPRVYTATTKYSHIYATPLTEVVGAECHGVDLSQPVGDKLIEMISSALGESGVVLFRDQNITSQQHIDFSRKFGMLDIHVLDQFHLPGYPEIYVVSNVVENGRHIGAHGGARHFHSDLSYNPEPSMGSLFLCRECPPVGGETEFAGMFAAYEALPEERREWLKKQRGVHDYVYHYETYLTHRMPLTKEQKAKLSPTAHPAVRTHPESGRNAIYLSQALTTHLEGLEVEEGRRMIKEICEFATRPRFVYRHRWRVGDLVFWDNRAVMHRVLPFDEQKYRRVMHRTTVRGERPFLKEEAFS